MKEHQSHLEILMGDLIPYTIDADKNSWDREDMDLMIPILLRLGKKDIVQDQM